MPVWEVVPIVLDLGDLGQAMAQIQKEECSMFGGERSSFERHRSSFERHRPCFWRHRSRIEQDSGSLPRRMGGADLSSHRGQKCLRRGKHRVVKPPIGRGKEMQWCEK